MPFLLSEEQSPWVMPLLESDVMLMAPDLILAELANALWAAGRRRGLPAAEIQTLLALGRRRLGALAPLTDLVDRAMALAIAVRHPAYDCFYVALAERERLPIITCDRRLAVAFGRSIDVRLLGPPEPSAPPPRHKR